MEGRCDYFKQVNRGREGGGRRRRGGGGGKGRGGGGGGGERRRKLEANPMEAGFHKNLVRVRGHFFHFFLVCV